MGYQTVWLLPPNAVWAFIANPQIQWVWIEKGLEPEPFVSSLKIPPSPWSRGEGTSPNMRISEYPIGPSSLFYLARWGWGWPAVIVIIALSLWLRHRFALSHSCLSCYVHVLLVRPPPPLQKKSLCLKALSSVTGDFSCPARHRRRHRHSSTRKSGRGKRRRQSQSRRDSTKFARTSQGKCLLTAASTALSASDTKGKTRMTTTRPTSHIRGAQPRVPWLLDSPAL